MKLAVAIHFDATQAQVAGVAFDAWDSPEPMKTYLSHIAQVDKAVRGTLDLRGLACMMQLLQEHKLEPELILIDGFAHLDGDETPGLGQHLFQALGGKTPVIGISKTGRPGLSSQFEVMREEEARPLIVTGAGIDIGAAKARLRAMHGRKVVPTLMKLALRLAKNRD